MKELKETVRKEIPYEVKLKIATTVRDMSEVAKNKTLELGYEFSVEAFNDKNYMRMPDKIGITLFYPSQSQTTHMICEIFPIEIGEVSFGDQVTELCNKLKNKIEGI